MALVDAAVLAEIESIVRDAIEANFESDARQRRLGWAPLSDSYVQQLARQGRLAGKRILVDTGRLRGSIATRPEPNKNAVVAGTNVVYAPVHQFGGMAGRGRRARIPKRPFLALLPEDLRDIAEAVAPLVARNLVRELLRGVRRDAGA